MISERLTVNILGRACSGKSTVTRHLTEQLGFTLYRPSDTIRSYARAHDLPLRARRDYIAASANMVIEDDQAIIRPIIESDIGRLCVDGLRSPVHIQHLRQEIGMITLALVAPPEVRFGRLLAATTERIGRDDSNIRTLAEFIADEAADDDPAMHHLSSVTAAIELADHTIDASQTYQSGTGRNRDIP